MTIQVNEVFKLSRIIHKLYDQQMSYEIKTAFELYNLVKWLDDTEKYLFERLSMYFDNQEIDFNNAEIQPLWNMPINFINTPLTIEDLQNTIDIVKIDISDVELLKKMFGKTEE